MSEPKFENWFFEKLNFDDFPTLRETFSLKNGPKFKKFGQYFTFLYPLQRLNSFFVNIVPLWETFKLWKRYSYRSRMPVTYFCLSGPPRVTFRIQQFKTHLNLFWRRIFLDEQHLAWKLWPCLFQQLTLVQPSSVRMISRLVSVVQQNKQRQHFQSLSAETMSRKNQNEYEIAL